MRVIRTVGACAVALALSGVGAGVASAETEYPLTGLPELGRCVKVAPGTGRFNTGQCLGVDKDGNDGSWEWKPGPGEKGTFKLKVGSPLVETVGGGKVSCTVAFMKGEFTSGKGVKVTETVIDGCLNVKPNKTCYSNILEPGKIVSSQTLVGEIGFITNTKNPANPYVGVDLKAEPESVPLLTFNCGEQLGAESVALEGSVIGQFKILNKMLSTMQLNYKQKAGLQKPESFKGGVKDTITQTTTPISNPLGKTSEQAGLTGDPGSLEIGENIELKAKQH